MRLDYLAAERETQTGAGGLGRVERTEDGFLFPFSDSGTVVDHFDARAGRQAHRTGGRLGQRQLPGTLDAHLDRTRMGGGVAGVEHQVQQYLLDLRRIQVERPERIANITRFEFRVQHQ